MSIETDQAVPLIICLAKVNVKLHCLLFDCTQETDFRHALRPSAPATVHSCSFSLINVEIELFKNFSIFSVVEGPSNAG